jgi:hypothetical protein
VGYFANRLSETNAWRKARANDAPSKAEHPRPFKRLKILSTEARFFASRYRRYPKYAIDYRKGFMEVKYERAAEVIRVMTEGEAVVLVVVNGKEGTGYAVHADSGLNELLPAILRRVAQMIES